MRYQVDPIKLGIVKTIDLIRQSVPASIDTDGIYLTVDIKPVDALLFAEKLNGAGIEWWLPGEEGR